MNKQERATTASTAAGWYAHPNIGLMRVFETKGIRKFCPIRKDGNGRFTSMRPTFLTDDIAACIKMIPLPAGVLDIQDKDHMPVEVKKFYHRVNSLFKETYNEDEETSQQ
jgi:hypothetical protein